MKAKDIIIQNGGTKFFLGSNLSVRSFLKHLITFTYLGLVLYTLLNIDINLKRVNMQNLMMISQSMIIIFFFVSSAITSLNMLNLSFRGFIVTTVFILGAVAGSITFMIIRNHVQIHHWKELAVNGYIYVALPIYIGIWKLTIAIIETKSSPFLSKKMIYDGVESFIYAAVVLMSMFLMKETILADPKVSISPWKHIQMLYMLGISIGTILYLYIFYLGWKKYGKKIIKVWHIKSISLSLGIILVIPLAIWMPLKTFNFRLEWQFIAYIAFDVLLISIVFIYSFIKRTELGSPKIYTILITMTITLIWANKFLYGYQFRLLVPDDFTLTIALGTTSLILLIQYFKSPNIGKGVAIIYRIFAVIIFILSIALWVSLHFVVEIEIIKKLINIPNLDIPELLNSLLLIIPTMLALVSIISWTVTMQKIKRYSKKKKYMLTKKMKKKIERKEMIKEVLNA